MLREAIPSTFDKCPEANRVECNICQRACKLTEGGIGFCSGYQAENGTLIDLTYGKITTAQVTKLGWAPVSDYADPSDEILSVGSRGCNLRCSHCINFTHAFARHDRKDDTLVSPTSLVEYAKLMGCKGIAANFNEGLLAVAFWKDIFEAAHAQNLYTIAVTNGYATRQVLDVICPHLDVYRCDIKAIKGSTMRQQGNQGVNPQGILDSLTYVKEHYPATHIEIVTMISPGINDSPEEIQKIVTWIRDNLGADTPWHISPMDPIQTSKTVPPPAYIKPDEIMTNNTFTGFSITFDNSGAFLQVGNNDLISLSTSSIQTDLLEKIATIGRDSGLRNVIIKTDGH